MLYIIFCLQVRICVTRKTVLSGKWQGRYHANEFERSDTVKGGFRCLPFMHNFKSRSLLHNLTFHCQLSVIYQDHILRFSSCWQVQIQYQT
jgi:hypothetical protein